MKGKKVNIGIIGATGLVGGLIREILIERKFPVGHIRFFASKKSAGKKIRFKSKQIPVESVENADFSGLDLVFLAAGGRLSMTLAPQIVKKGAIVIDNSSYWRLDTKVPLIVSGVNEEVLKYFKKGIISKPNCTTMIAMPILQALHRKSHLREVVVTTFQAVSGTGQAGITQLMREVGKYKTVMKNLPFRKNTVSPVASDVYPAPIAFNVIPLAGSLVDDGTYETDEEQKFRNESRKILNLPKLKVAATCVRVPVFTGHALSIYAIFEKSITPENAAKVIGRIPHVRQDPVPSPLKIAGTDHSVVGRIRQGSSANHLSFFVAGDNLREGAALNSVQVAEYLAKKDKI